MKIIFFKKLRKALKYLSLLFLILSFTNNSAFSEISYNINQIRSWDHGTYYRIVFVLESPDSASVTRNGKSPDIMVKFNKSGFKKEKAETVNKKYIKDFSFIQENPLVLKITLQDSNYKTSTMELKNPSRFVLDVKKITPVINDKKDIVKKDKIKKIEKEQIVKKNQPVTEQVAVKKPPPLKKNPDIKKSKNVLSEEKILDKLIPADASEEFLSAVNDMKEEKYEDAYKVFSSIADGKGKCSLISEVLSAEALIKKDSEKNKDNFLKAIEILNNASGKASDPLLMAKIYYLLGNTYSNIEFYVEAEGYFKILQNNYSDSYYAKTGKFEMAKILSINNRLDESGIFLNELSDNNLNSDVNKDILLLYFNNYVKKKEYKKACEKFEKAVGISKDSEISEISFDDWYRYAESLYQTKRYKEAKGIFIEVSGKEIDKEKKARSMLRLGDIAFAENDENGAFNIWSMIPLNYENTVAAGEAILRITSVKLKDPENIDEAIANYSKIIADDFPVIVKNGAIKETVKLFSKNHQYNKALLFLNNIKTDENEELRLIVKMETIKIFNNGLSFFREEKDKNRALELYFRYNELQTLNVKDFESSNILFLSETLTDSAYFKKAREILQTLYIGTFNQNLAFNCQYLTGLSYLKEKEYEKAVSRFKKLMNSRIKKEDIEKVSLKLAETLYFQKKYDDSLKYLQKIKKQNSYSEFLIAKNYFFISDYKNALLHFHNSVKLSKNFSTEDDLYYKSLFWESYCNLKMGETEEALSILERIDDKWKKDNSDNILFLKAQILNKKGNGQDALKILKDNPDKNTPIALIADNLKEEIDFNITHKRALNYFKRKEIPLKNE